MFDSSGGAGPPCVYRVLRGAQWGGGRIENHTRDNEDGPPGPLAPVLPRKHHRRGDPSPPITFTAQGNDSLGSSPW